MTITVVEPTQWEDAPWMVPALGELGQREVPGGGDNPRIVEYQASCVAASHAASLGDESPWCSAYANWCMDRVAMRDDPWEPFIELVRNLRNR